MRLDIRAQNVALTAPLLARVETRDHHRRAPARFSRAAGSELVQLGVSRVRDARHGAACERGRSGRSQPPRCRSATRADQQGVGRRPAA